MRKAPASKASTKVKLVKQTNQACFKGMSKARSATSTASEASKNEREGAKSTRRPTKKNISPPPQKGEVAAVCGLCAACWARKKRGGGGNTIWGSRRRFARGARRACMQCVCPCCHIQSSVRKEIYIGARGVQASMLFVCPCCPPCFVYVSIRRHTSRLILQHTSAWRHPLHLSLLPAMLCRVILS